MRKQPLLKDITSYVREMKIQTGPKLQPFFCIVYSFTCKDMMAQHNH